MCIEVGEHGSVREGIKEVGSGKKGLQDESVMVELRLEGWVQDEREAVRWGKMGQEVVQPWRGLEYVQRIKKPLKVF